MTDQLNIGIGRRNFFAWISEHRTSVVLPESAILYPVGCLLVPVLEGNIWEQLAWVLLQARCHTWHPINSVKPLKETQDRWSVPIKITYCLILPSVTTGLLRKVLLLPWYQLSKASTLFYAHAYMFMVALWNRASHYVFIRWFLLSFFPRLISAVADWMSAILPHMVWPWCKFKMQVWNVLHAARCKYRMQKLVKNLPSGHHRITLSGYIFATKAHINNRKKTC